MDATQWAGVIAFSWASILRLWFRRRPWRLVGTLNMVMGIESGLWMRHYAHIFAIGLMGPIYPNRVNLQIGILIAAAMIVDLAVLLRLKSKNRRALAALMLAKGLACSLFPVEIISLSPVAEMIYQQVVSLLIIGSIGRR